MTVPSSVGLANASVAGYSFDISDLRVSDRRPGISAFMRIRNGADFLETTIRSHIEYFDEIVAVHNQCTDATPEILARLQLEFGSEKLRVIHYTDSVYPPGSDGHISTAPNSPHSLVNYYNFALAATRYQFATKLDDDHLAIESTTKAITDSIRSGNVAPDTMLCFSGLNVYRSSDGGLAILASDPISGGGDIGFFPVTAETHFTHDRRFERFQRGRMQRTFAGFQYWHLKYMKEDMGFGNYDLELNPSSRYAKRKLALEKAPPESLDLAQLATRRRPNLANRISQVVSDKHALVASRDAAISDSFPEPSVADAIARTVDPKFFQHGEIVRRFAEQQLNCA